MFRTDTFLPSCSEWTNIGETTAQHQIVQIKESFYALYIVLN
jgi:hypothetical protein